MRNRDRDRFLDDWFEWLKAVAVRADELVGDPVVMDRFRRQLVIWRAEHEEEGPKYLTDRRGKVMENPIEFFPLRRLTIADQYARLAAIHDMICEKVRPISVWSGSKHNFNRLKAAIPWGVLCHHVKKLKDDDRQRVEQIRDRVEADIAGWVAQRQPIRDVRARRLERMARTGQDAGARQLSPPPQRRAWERIAIVGDAVELDGERFDRLRDGAIDFLLQLQQARGASIKSTDFAGLRPDRVFESLPPRLQVIIDKPGRGQSGYRMH